MSDVFREFRNMMGSKQRATLAYRPQANGQQERSVQTMIWSVRAYVERPDQSDWDDIVEKLTWAINTSFDNTRKETPFFLVHGWDPRNTMSAMLAHAPRGADQRAAYLWRVKTQRQYQYSLAWAKDFQVRAQRRRSEQQTELWESLNDKFKAGFEVGDAVWLYMARVKPGLTKKLAHLWHGPFRIIEASDDYRYKLKTTGTMYKFSPWVHASRLKPRALHPGRPSRPPPSVSDDLELDGALLPEDSWEPDEEAGEFEVEAILDVRWEKVSRTSPWVRKYLVQWVGYEEPTWVEHSKLACGHLLFEFDSSARAKARFAAMQSGDS